MLAKSIKVALLSFTLSWIPNSTLALDEAKSVIEAEAKSSGNSSNTSLDETFKSQAREYEKAFAAGDAAKISAMWSDKGTYIDTDGWEYSGRKAIEDRYKEFFARPKKGNISLTVQSVQPIGGSAAIEKGLATFKDSQGNELSSCTYTVVHVLNNGRWEIASATDHGEVDAQDKVSIKDLSWMLGTWTAKGENGQATVSTRLANGDHFLITRFILKDDQGKGREEMQITGFDPTQNALVSWIFDSNGGFGQARWYKSGKGWESRMTRVTHGGQRLAAVNYWDPSDPNSFCWQSTKRVFEGMALPDSEKITVTRSTELKAQ